MIRNRIFKSKAQSQMTFLPEGEVVDFLEAPEVTILDVALAADIPLGHSCGGNGICTTCRVFVEKGLELLNERGELEREAATERGYLPEERLGCQTVAVHGLVVRLP